MPPSLRIEIYRQDADKWFLAGQIKPGDPDGSISDNHAKGRDVYIFGVDPFNNQGYIKKSELGTDEADAKTRIIHSIGFNAVAILNPGENHEMIVRTDASGQQARRIRFTYFED